MPDFPCGNVTFVFTDVEKSIDMTSLLERLGRRGVYEEILQGPQRVRLKAEAGLRGGREIQCNGDGHMFVFQRAADALDCVIAFQRSLLADPITHREGDEDFSIRVRVGVHTTVLQRDPKPLENGLVEYPGADTGFAFRVMSIGQGGQILISELAAKEAESLGEYRLHPWRNRLLKGFEERAHTIHELLYDPKQEPHEPGMQWLPDWYQSEKKPYIERPRKELEVVEQFMRKSRKPGDSYGHRAAGKDGHRIVTIKAEGGMGKTRLALACATKVADLFPDGVCFVPLAEVSPNEAAVAEAIGRALGLGGKQAMPAAVREYLLPRTVLLILDNFESVISPADDPEQKVALYLNQLIAKAHGLRLLVAGRSPVKIIDVEKIIPLDDGMEDDEALALFLDRARLRWGSDRDLTAAERPHWDRIRNLTDRIPLAIELAAAWVGYSELQEIADGLAATPLGDHTALPPGAIRSDSEIALQRHDSLTRSLDWSYHLLGRNAGRAAQSLFATCGLFADSFDSLTLATIAGVASVQTDLYRLQDASLVRREPSDGSNRYRLHRFTREYALQRLDEDPGANETRRRYLAHYVPLIRENATDPNNSGGYAVLDQEWRNALAAPQVAESFQDKLSLLSMIPLGGYFGFRGLWSEAESYYLRCLAIIQSSMAIIQSTPGRRIEGVIRNNMGLVYEVQGRYDEALDAYDQSLLIEREFNNRVGEAKTLGNLGNVYRLQSRYIEALDAYDRSLLIFGELKDRVGEGQTLNNMGLVYEVQGRYDEALDAYDRSLVITREFEDRVGEGRTLNNMGLVYQARGRYDEALGAYERSLVIFREFKDRVDEAQTLNNMGVVYNALDRYDEALDAYDRSLVIRRELKDRIGEAQTLGNMSNVYRLQDRYDEALDASDRSLVIFRKLKDRVSEGKTLGNLAHLLEAQGRLPEAIEWARQAVEVLKATEARVNCEKARRTLERLERLASEGQGAEG